MVYTLGEAAKATGKSKSAISKAIKSGRISASKDDTGTFRIDPSELHRVYPPTPMGEHEETPKEVPVNTTETGDFKALQARLEATQERLADKEAVIADLREDRDKWRQQATALLDDKRPQGFFKRLWGR